MDENGELPVVHFLTGMILGAVIGASAAVLMAPQSGKKTRRKIQRSASKLAITAGDRWDDMADEVRNRVDDALTTARKRLHN